MFKKNFEIDTSEFIKLDQTSPAPANSSLGVSNKKSYYTFQWNSEPSSVICVFPYVIGFANQCIEIRLLVNGNLVNSITMSNIKLIASKVALFSLVLFFCFEMSLIIETLY